MSYRGSTRLKLRFEGLESRVLTAGDMLNYGDVDLAPGSLADQAEIGSPVALRAVAAIPSAIDLKPSTPVIQSERTAERSLAAEQIFGDTLEDVMPPVDQVDLDFLAG